MAALSDGEKVGLKELLQANGDLLFQLARSLTKNIVDVKSECDALDIVCLHTSSASVLLSKRLITKDILFKYLYSKQVPVNMDFTKAVLINKILEFWNEPSYVPRPVESGSRTEAAESNQLQADVEYPIHLLARKFSEWFFAKLNEGSLKVDDVWSDCRLDLRIAATDRIDDQRHSSSQNVIDSLESVRKQFGFYFHPNLCYEGVQGRMDIHGLVLVLACGTLHSANCCVGVFECTFGLMRDPFSENNWKIKTIRMLFRSQNSDQPHQLNESSTLKDVLSLPAPSGNVI